MHTRRTAIERRLGFLNAVLAANAVLLAGLLWSALAGAPGGNAALAAPQGVTAPQGQGDNFPNSSAQRLQIVAELKGLRGDVAKLESLLAGGRMKVNVANPGDIKFEFDYAKLRQAIKE